MDFASRLKIMNKSQLSILISPGFVIALFALLVNDFILKTHYHNWLTGKLSDVAGLFLFPLFWFAIFPKFRKAIYVFTALFFVLWKSSYSQALIDTWNALPILPLSRVVDVTDLVALIVLPLSYVYSIREKRTFKLQFAPHLMAAISIFAFTATSYRTNVDFDNKYYFVESRSELTRKLNLLAHMDNAYQVESCVSIAPDHSIMEVAIPSDFCSGNLIITVHISEEDGRGVLVLKKIGHKCSESKNDKQKLLPIFEKTLIEKIKQIQLVPPNIATSDGIHPSKLHPINRASQLYFVQFGDSSQINVDALVEYFKRKYGVSIKALPAVAPMRDESAADAGRRKQLVEIVAAELKRAHPNVVADPNAIIIGIGTSHEPLSTRGGLATEYELDGRFALIRSESLNPTTFCEPANQQLLESRLRKMIARNIGVLYYGLSGTDYPNSVMNKSLENVYELDQISEEF